MHRVRRRVAAALTAVAACGLAACTAQAPAPQPTGLPAGIEVSFVQLRSDVASRQAEVRIRNGGDEALIVGAVSVADPRFDGAAERIVARTSTIPAGASTDIRVQLPPVACPAPDDAAATVSIGYTVDGVDAVAVAPLPDPLAFVPPLHERECLAAALAEAADVSFTAFVPSDAGEPADLELTVAPTGDGAAQLTGIRETNLLTFDMPGSAGGLWPLEVAVRPGDTAPFVVHLPLVPARCDPHAVLEDKRGTVFWVEAVIGDEPSRIDLATGEEMRGRILTWVAHWCGYGP
jgi:hypothetical protein